MIAVGILTLMAIVWRIRIHAFTRVEMALLALIVGNWMMIWAQINIADGVAFPEKRYWIESFVLLCGWAVWGIERVSSHFSDRIPCLKYVIFASLSLLIVFDLVMIAKPHIPIGRRFAYNKACAWAVGVIRRDWRGPDRDVKNPFSIKEYHRANRPVVEAFSQLVPYELKGRRENVKIFGKIDTPDYIVIDKKKAHPPKRGYEKIAFAEYASREFEIYRLNKKRPPNE